MDSKIVLLGVLVLLAYPVTTLEQAQPNAAPKSRQETGVDILLNEPTKFVGYSEDFLNMAKSYQGNDNLEYEIASNLSTIAGRCRYLVDRLQCRHLCGRFSPSDFEMVGQ